MPYQEARLTYLRSMAKADYTSALEALEAMIDASESEADLTDLTAKRNDVVKRLPKEKADWRGFFAELFKRKVKA